MFLIVLKESNLAKILTFCIVYACKYMLTSCEDYPPMMSPAYGLTISIIRVLKQKPWSELDREIPRIVFLQKWNDS